MAIILGLLPASGEASRVPVRKKGAATKPGLPKLPEKPAKPTPKPVPGKPSAPEPGPPVPDTKPPSPATTPLKPTALVAPKVEWKPVYYRGRAYVPVEQVASYYDLNAPRVDGKAITMVSKQFTIGLNLGEKRIKLNGWTFYFSFKVVEPKDQILVSVFDVRNVLDPILRPNDRRDPSLLKTIIIDPSGGGKEAGIKTKALAEKDLTLDVALKMEALLRKAGYEVVLTRSEDVFVSPTQRLRLANAVKGEALFLSLRGSSGAQSARGFECSTLPPAGTPATFEPDEVEPDKKFFAGNINDRESLALATTLQSSVVTGMKMIDLGIKRFRFEELRDINIPAIVCRLGFLSNKIESGNLADPAYRDRMAEHLCHGISRYADYLRSDMDSRLAEEARRPLQFGEITLKAEPQGVTLMGEKTTLNIPIRAAEGIGVDRSRVEVQVYLFETVNGAEIDMATADPPGVRWLSVLPDWVSTREEYLEAEWVRPVFSSAEAKVYGKRATHGYVARLIYDGRVMDEVSFPQNLHRCLYYFTQVFPRR